MSVVVLERESRAGEGVSSRNSGVIHAGMYYPADSLKTKFCVTGNRLLYEYAERKNINHKKIGKYIIASQEADLEKLKNIYEQGLANGVTLKIYSKDEIKIAQPDLIIEGGIYSPETGIIDVPELVTALEGDIQHNQGVVSFNTSFISAKKNGDYFEVACNDGNDFSISTKMLVNSSGLYSDIISDKIDPLDSKFYSPIYYAKGHYFKYSGDHPFNSLVYPLASEFSSGLHVGFDMAGQLRFGPDITWVDHIDFTFNEALKEKFVNSIHNYWPDMDPEKLQPDYVGIRPKLQNPNEKMKDFSILGPEDHGVNGLINLQGIESPGVTSCLAIGNYMSEII
jgi:L-2-hydroxyglutarate oxidase LhgO